MRLQEFIYLMIGLNLAGLSIIALFKRKNILSFFFPHKWVEVEMVESDNNTQIWLQKKTTDLTFKFNGEPYNMFHKEDKESKYSYVEKEENGVMIKEKVKLPQSKRKFPIYRAGRLAKFLYIEGNPNPVDLRQVEVAESSSLQRILTSNDIEGLFAEDHGFLGNIQLKDIILFGGIAILIFLMVG